MAVNVQDAPLKVRLKRLKLGDYRFKLNPQQWNQDERGLFNLQHTAGGGYVEHYGADWPRISFSGTTGSGYGRELAACRDEVRDFWLTAPRRPNSFLAYHNFTDDEHYWVLVESFSVRRSIDRPTLYGYAISLVAVASMGGRSLAGGEPMIDLDMDSLADDLAATGGLLTGVF